MTESVPQETEPKPDLVKELRDILLLARGGDPQAQSLLQEIFKIDYIQEKTNFPTAINQQKQTFLMMAAAFFGDEFGAPFREMAKFDAITWRSYKGFNYNGDIEILKKGTDLSGLIMQPQTPVIQAPEPKRRFWQRNKTEVLEDWSLMPKRNYDDWQRVKELTTMGKKHEELQKKLFAGNLEEHKSIIHWSKDFQIINGEAFNKFPKQNEDVSIII